MAPASADRNLLFGILALQLDSISRDQLVAAMQAWVLEKTTSLGELLLRQGALGTDRLALLEALVNSHLALHGDDPHQSLAALSVVSSIKEMLAPIADTDLHQTLAFVPATVAYHQPAPREIQAGGDDPDSTVAPAAAGQAGEAVGLSSASGVRFRILRPHREGGLGEVVVAFDGELHREVALKKIKDRHADNADARARFVREGEITGKLEHPGIVPIYSLGHYAGGQPFYAMRFIKGDSLEDAISQFHKADAEPRSESERTMELRKLLGRFVDVCEAISYAHSRGVLHRDLKPGNIMLGRYGETLVVDWGLAKAQGESEPAGETQTPASASLAPVQVASGSGSNATELGSVLGTPAYMPPEQAEGRLGELGPASDVYSLGATLYALLTGHSPVEGERNVGLILMRVCAGEIPPPRQVNAKVPAALEAVCCKAMALKAKDRYASAQQLADEVERWLADEPVRAWPEPRAVRARRWMRRHRAVVTGAAAALLVGVLSLIGVSFILAERNQRLHDANLETQHANEQLKSVNDKLDLDLTNTTMMLARSRFEENNVGLADDLLEQVPAKYRGASWGLLKNYVAGSLFTLYGHTGVVTSVSYSPDGQTLASASADQTVRLWDAKTGQQLRVLEGHTSYVTSVSYSPDGQTLASGSIDKTVRLWDAKTGQELRVLTGHTGVVQSVSYSPDGQTLASASGDKTVRLWDAKTGQELHVLKGHTNDVRSVSYSPDGQTLASASPDKTVRLWDPKTGQELRVLTGHTNVVTSVSYSPDGQTLASASGDGTVRLWDPKTGQELRVLKGHAYVVNSVSYSPDGQTLASANNDKTVRLWDAKTGQELRVLKGHTNVVTTVSYSPDGQTLASASGDLFFPADDNTLRLWDAKMGQERRVLTGHTAQVTTVSYSPDGQTLASASGDGTVRLWDPKTGQELRVLKGRASLNVSCSPDGQTLALASGDGTVRLWDAKTGLDRRVLKGHTGAIMSVSYSPDGQTLASAGADNTVRLWDAKTGQQRHVLKGHTNEVRSVSYSPDGQTLASASYDKTVRLWDAKTGQQLHVLKGHSNAIASVSYSPDGQTLASAGYDQTVRLWDAKTGQQLHVLKGHTNYVTSVSYSPDGQTLASASMDKTVRLWDAKTGQELRVLKGHTFIVNSVSYSPDGQTLASASDDKTVRLWDVKTNQLVRGSLSPAELSYRRWVTSPDLQWHKDQVEQFQKTDPAAAAFHLGWYLAGQDYYAALKEQPAAPPNLQSAILSRGRLWAGLLMKTAGPALAPLLAEAARDAAQPGSPWQSHALYGAALYRAGDGSKALQELTLALKLRGQPNVWLAAFLAMTHAQLGESAKAKEWLTKLAPPADAPWEELALAALLAPETNAKIAGFLPGKPPGIRASGTFFYPRMSPKEDPQISQIYAD